MLTKKSLCTAGFFAGLLLVSACGGGGGGGGAADPTVNTMSVAASAKYSDTLLITLSGTNLDSAGLTVASPGCKTMTRSNTAPNVSDASTAYYTCTVSAVGTQTVTATRASDGAALQSATFTVAQPKVRLTISNSAATFTGSMEFTLDPAKAPITVDNFLRYVREDFYPNTVFHRVARTNALSPWAIQAGARLGSAPLKTVNPRIALEVGNGLSNAQWTVAMARTSKISDSNAPNTATYQFFNNIDDNQSFLDPHTPTNASDDGLGYAVFGNVSAGTNVATTIAAAPCVATTGVTLAPDCTPDPYMIITSAIQTH